jgi:hypothetical protein
VACSPPRRFEQEPRIDMTRSVLISLFQFGRSAAGRPRLDGHALGSASLGLLTDPVRERAAAPAEENDDARRCGAIHGANWSQ